MSTPAYDVVVVGAGPNGLSAAITMQRAGLQVLLLEAKDTIGGGSRSAALTLPGFTHDICSAIHPLAVCSPFFKTLPLHQFGLEFIYPSLAAAHPFDDGSAAVLSSSLEETSQSLANDGPAYRKMMEPLVQAWDKIGPDILGPLQLPHHPLSTGLFGLRAITTANYLAGKFATKQARGLIAGMAAHAIQPLTNLATSAIALVLLTTGHRVGWPIPKGGSQAIADALAAYFTSLGGTIQTNSLVSNLNDIPKSKAILFDLTPRQIVSIAGNEFSRLYKWQLSRYKYGMGVFKVDWALSEPIPFTNADCRRAGTVHLGNTFEEIGDYEAAASEGKVDSAPFVLLAQQSVFDSSRAPQGKHTAWAYCHVPNGSDVDMTNAIEAQVERFAPGFKQTILSRHTMTAKQVHSYNANYVGGDINGGVIDITQLFTRPALRLSPYKTSAERIFICSSSTPPGGGVHGMCGYYAARRALADVFGIKVPRLQ